MSVLVKVIEERTQWAERNREAETRRKKMREFLKHVFVVMFMLAVIYNYREICEVIRSFMISLW